MSFSSKKDLLATETSRVLTLRLKTCEQYFRIPERHAFCIFLSTSLALATTSFCRVASKSLDHSPRTSIMIFYWAISYRGCLCSISHLSGAYFMAFSDVFLSRLFTQVQRISSVMTCLCWLLTILASTLFAFSS